MPMLHTYGEHTRGYVVELWRILQQFGGYERPLYGSTNSMVYGRRCGFLCRMTIYAREGTKASDPCTSLYERSSSRKESRRLPVLISYAYATSMPMNWRIPFSPSILRLRSGSPCPLPHHWWRRRCHRCTPCTLRSYLGASQKDHGGGEAWCLWDLADEWGKDRRARGSSVRLGTYCTTAGGARATTTCTRGSRTTCYITCTSSPCPRRFGVVL